MGSAGVFVFVTGHVVDACTAFGDRTARKRKHQKAKMGCGLVVVVVVFLVFFGFFFMETIQKARR